MVDVEIISFLRMRVYTSFMLPERVGWARVRQWSDPIGCLSDPPGRI